MADIIDLSTSKLEFFYITILSRMLSQNLFKIRKTIWLKMKSSIILISVKIINIFHKMKYKVVIGIISVVRSLLLYFITKMQMIVFNMNHLFLYLIIWIMINFGLPGTNFQNIQDFKNYHNQEIHNTEVTVLANTLSKSIQSVQWVWWNKKMSGILVPHHMEKVTLMD